MGPFLAGFFLPRILSGSESAFFPPNKGQDCIMLTISRGSSGEEDA